MYAVIEAGGQQYKVTQGDNLKIDFFPSDVGSSVVFDQVIFIHPEEGSFQIGQPHIAGAQVLATVIAHGRLPKIKIFKMRRRKHHQKHQGHRQNFTQIRIDTIVNAT